MAPDKQRATVMEMNGDNLSRKTVILREAASLFRERGYLSSNLRELARRSGIQGGSIYHHFSSKQEILFQLMEVTMTEMIEKLSRQFAPNDPPLEKLRKAVLFHIQYHVSVSNETYITDGELSNLDKDKFDHIVAMRKRYQQIFESILDEGASSGTMTVPDKKITTRAIIQMCTAVSLWFKHGGELSVHEVADKYMEFICNGISVRQAALKRG